MARRRTHSSIDLLPRDLLDVITRMLIDGIWPEDYPSLMDAIEVGKPRYEDIVRYCKHKGFDVSPSAIGRWAKRMFNWSRMKEMGLIARETMKDVADNSVSVTQKAAAEIITAHIIDLATSDDKITAKQARDLATAVKDCVMVTIKSNDYSREEQIKKAEKVAESTKKKLKKAGVDRKVIQEIIDEHLGVTKS
jgi:Bacteriophage Mu, Gp27